MEVFFMYCTTTFSSPLGDFSLISDTDSLVGLWFQNPKYACDIPSDQLIPRDDLAIFSRTKKWLNDYFEGRRPSPNRLPLAPKGSEFQQAVWKILCEIPYGQVITYGDVAKEIALQRGLAKMSAQAVGGAVGRNPISIIIPCHRVIGAGGNLTGYGGGIDRKIRLLELEGCDINRFSIPKKGTAL